MEEHCNYDANSTNENNQVPFPHQNAVLSLINDAHLFVLGGFGANWSTLTGLWHCSVEDMLWKKQPIDWEKLFFLLAGRNIEKGENLDWKNDMVSRMFQKNTVATCLSNDNCNIVYLFAFHQIFDLHDLAFGRLRISINGEMGTNNQPFSQISQQMMTTHFEQLEFLNENEDKNGDTILAIMEEENSFLFAVNENHFVCVPSDFVENRDGAAIYSIIASKGTTACCEQRDVVATKWECEVTMIKASNTTKMVCDGDLYTAGVLQNSCSLEEKIFEEMRLKMGIDLGGILAFQFNVENDDSTTCIGIMAQGTKQKWAEDDDDMEQIRNQTEPPECYAGTNAQHYMIIFRVQTRQFVVIDSIRPDPRFGFPCYRDGPALTFHQPSKCLFMVGGIWKNVYLAPEQQNRVLGEIWRFDLCTFQWAKLEQEMPTPVFNASAQICNNGSMFVFGGATSTFAAVGKQNACSNCCSWKREKEYNNDDSSAPPIFGDERVDATNIKCFDNSSSRCMLKWEKGNNNLEEFWQLGILDSANDIAAAIQQIDLQFA